MFLGFTIIPLLFFGEFSFFSSCSSGSFLEIEVYYFSDSLVLKEVCIDLSVFSAEFVSGFIEIILIVLLQENTMIYWV